MLKDGNVNLTCRQCGKEFIFTKAEQEFYELKGFTTPCRCKECRLARQIESQRLTCSECGDAVEKGTSIYCPACLASGRLEFEKKTRESQKSASAAHSKLLASETQKAELAESIRRKDEILAELELKVDSLIQELDKAYQFHTVLGTLQPTLNGIAERLEALDRANNKTNERMLQIVQKMHEMNEQYENISLLEIIKRSLGNYQRQGT